MSKAAIKNALVGLGWFLAFSAVTGLVVRPALKKVAEKTKVPLLGTLV